MREAKITYNPPAWLTVIPSAKQRPLTILPYLAQVYPKCEAETTHNPSKERPLTIHQHDRDLFQVRSKDHSQSINMGQIYPKCEAKTTHNPSKETPLTIHQHGLH